MFKRNVILTILVSLLTLILIGCGGNESKEGILERSTDQSLDREDIVKQDESKPVEEESESNLIVAAADPWPPFVDPDQEKQGVAMEIIRAAFESQGYEVKWENMPFPRAMEGTLSGEYDIIPHAWFTEERSENLLYSDPYLVNKIVFIGRKESDFVYEGLGSLDGKTIGTIRGYAYDDAFLAAENFIRDEVSSFMQNIEKLITGRIDLTLEDEIVARYTINQEAKSMETEVTYISNPISEENLYIVSAYTNPRHKEIIEAFNRGLEEIKRNGTYDVILESHGLK